MEEVLAESSEAGVHVKSNALGTESQDDVAVQANAEAISVQIFFWTSHGYSDSKYIRIVHYQQYIKYT
jgi:hypothetical protein